MEFWTNDLKQLAPYLSNEFEMLWDQVENELEFFDAWIKTNKTYEARRQAINSALAKKMLKKQNLIENLEIDLVSLRDVILNELNEDIINEEFQNIHRKELLREYERFHRRATKIGSTNTVKLLERYMIKLIEQQKITPEEYNQIMNKKLLPSEGEFLRFFIIEPQSSEEFKSLRNLAKQLQEWNEREELFDNNKINGMLEKFLKNQASILQELKEKEDLQKKLDKKRQQEQEEQEKKRQQ